MLSILYLVLKHGLYLKTKEIQNVNPDDLISHLAYFVILTRCGPGVRISVYNEQNNSLEKLKNGG